MGRLQRKKPVSKKKKKGNGDQSTVAADAENKVVSLTDFSIDKKKQPPPRKKISGAAKPANATPRYWDKGLQFLREVRIELKKVTWPSRAQTMGSTAVVLILVIIISFFLGLVDMGLSGLVQLILH
ncbi:MAG: preprotein translocase subunit SecE [Desulfobacterales bacterium]